jgi:hypothetical protein
MTKRRSGSGSGSLGSKGSPEGDEDRASSERIDRLRELLETKEKVDLPSLPPRAKRWTLLIATVVIGLGLGLKALFGGGIAASLKVLLGG